ncbi:hypothetical protein AB1E18_009440 [Capra hircus]
MSGICGPLKSGRRRTRSPHHPSGTIQPSGRIQESILNALIRAGVAIIIRRNTMVWASLLHEGKKTGTPEYWTNLVFREEELGSPYSHWLKIPAT